MTACPFACPSETEDTELDMVELEILAALTDAYCVVELINTSDETKVVNCSLFMVPPG